MIAWNITQVGNFIFIQQVLICPWTIKGGILQISMSLTPGEDKEEKLGLAILREHKHFKLSSFSCEAWSQYCYLNMHNANLPRKLVRV